MNYRLIPSYLLMTFSCFQWLNNDLAKISRMAQQQKMSFNPDPSKPSQEIIFSKKVNKNSHSLPPPLSFNYSIVYQATSHKNLGIIIDNRLLFEEHLRPVFSKINRTIGLLRINGSSQDQPFLLSIKLLSDLILIMVTLYMKIL